MLVTTLADLSLHHSCNCFGLVLCIKCEGGIVYGWGGVENVPWINIVWFFDKYYGATIPKASL